jgi:hypothetical protein
MGQTFRKPAFAVAKSRALEVMAVADGFAKRHDNVKQPHDPNFIGVVSYPTQCKGMCSLCTPRQTLRMQDTLIKGLASVCSFQVLSKDLVFACQVAPWRIFRPADCFLL